MKVIVIVIYIWYIFRYLQPNHITKIVNTFSALVVAETFPNPTVVKLLNVKYNAVK